jgi:ATP-dependent Clp protease ATP-binding subunit ClpB
VDALQRRLGDRRLTLAVTPDARSWLAERGYDPVFGARPLRRLIQSEVQNKLATALLSGGVHDGDTVRVDLAADGMGLVLTSEKLDTGGLDDDVIEAELLDE